MEVLRIFLLYIILDSYSKGETVLHPTVEFLGGSKHFAVLGANVTLICMVSGVVDDHTIVVKWLLREAVKTSCRFTSTSIHGPTYEGPKQYEKSCILEIAPVHQSSEGEYECQLFDGKQVVSQSMELKIDTNECDRDEASCDVNAYCVDTPDGFFCTCKDGFVGNGTTGSCQEDSAAGGGKTDNTVLVAVISVLGVLLVTVVAAVVAYIVKCGRHRNAPQATQNVQSVGPSVALMVAAYEDRIAQRAATSYNTRITAQEITADLYTDVGLPSWACKWEISWKDLVVHERILGQGNFGEVRSGDLCQDGVMMKCAIKTVNDCATLYERDDFMRELRTMTLIGHHPNVVSLLGACRHQDILYVALEYLPHGDLRSYLREARTQSDSDEGALSSGQLVKFALDVAKGMEHLAMEMVIHRDLAARNILLGEGLIAKVSDFGLSRGEDVYMQMSSKRVPIRWLAIESVKHQTYSSQSDVWSFGILLWEIATLGGTPYPSIDSASLAAKLTEGYRMPKPNNCDEKIYGLMRQCWAEDPNDRPIFSELVSVLSEMDNCKIEHTYMSVDRTQYVNFDVICLELDDK